jgi:predicted permease
MSHARFALRIFSRGGGAYLLAIGVLALGIGMTTAVFSLVQTVLLQPLPFVAQDSLRVIWKADRKAGVPFIELAYPELGDLQQGVNAFDSVALMPTTLYGYGKVLQVGAKEPVQVESTPVSHDFFRTLGLTPVLGRDFSSSDEQVGAAPVVILSDSVWRQHFNSNRTIGGETIRLNGIGFTVIGVMAPAVDFPRGVGLWVPLGVNASANNRDVTYLQAIARVRRGYSDNQVKAQVNGLFQRLVKQFPGVYPAGQEAVITALPEYWTGSSRLHLLVSLAASFLLLATACITASNLFLSRALARSQEIATRTSVGASPLQLLIQFAAEGATAAILATLFGLAIAAALIQLLVFLAPPDIPRITGAYLSGGVLFFAAALSLAVALACSIAPALIATRLSLETLLREGSSRLTASRRGRRMQNAFILAQTSITVVLLAASLLVAVSVRAMLRADLGFANRDALTMNLALRGTHSDRNSRDRFYSRLLDRLRASPSVTSAGGVLLRPLEGAIGWEMHYQSEFDDSPPSQELPVSNFEVVTPDYFRTVGTPLQEGRDFTAEDTEDSDKVAVVSRGLADRLGKMSHNPIGTRIRFGRSSSSHWFRIVGIVADTRYRDVTTTGREIYVNYLQTSIPVNYLVVRGRGPLADLTRREVAQLDSSQAVANVATIAELIERNTARQRFNLTLLLAFGLGALLLAGAGVYSVVAESMSVRKREIAIRIALGAQRRVLIGSLVHATLRCVLLGELLGLFAAILIARKMSEMLYSVRPGDPVILAFTVVFLLMVSGFAALVPAQAAFAREPMAVLQGD